MATKKKKKVVKHVPSRSKKKPSKGKAKKAAKRKPDTKKAQKRKPKPSREQSKSGSKGGGVSGKGKKRAKPVASSDGNAERLRKRKPAKKKRVAPTKATKDKRKGKGRVTPGHGNDSGRKRKRAKAEEVKPKKKATKKPPRERVEVESLYAGGFARDRGVAQSGSMFTISSKGNNGDPSEKRVAQAFGAAFTNNLSKGPLEAKDVVIYNHGVHIRPREGNIGVGAVREIESIVKSFGIDAKIMVIEETPTIDSIRILAVNNEGSDVTAINKNLASLGAMWTEIFQFMEGEYEDVSWFVVWDVEESMY